MGDAPGGGRAVAVALAREGAAVAVAGRSGDPDAPPGARPLAPPLGDGPLADTARLLAEAGGATLAVDCDPTSEAECREVVAHTALEFGAIDVLALCGSAPPDADGLRELTTRRLEELLRATLYTALWFVRAARTHLADGASVVLPGSGAGRAGSGEHVGLAAGTGGVMSLTRSLADALRDRGVRVNCLVSDPRDDPADVAAAYVALAAGEGRHGTGEVLPVAEVLAAGG
ncbi:SDR family oxidoreductase [Nocardiopsis trehalosi]|jgi:NAD(P)-dependent dehydrogenase (short-subunit alcohol dehydrogenase family)|uniref:SDR family oxidoreductase n=1 Tax=Nocardiopsis trehalosi TaxID=109329 RepID=UPI001C3F4137|nr:SDR family oxidoreductase [Nocardiopsis trehalosi]